LPLDSHQSPVIVIVSNLTGQNFSYPEGTLGSTSPTNVNHNVNIPRGFETEVFTGRKPFLSPNQQNQSTEGTININKTATTHIYENKKNIISKSAGSKCCDTQSTKAAVILKALA